MGEPLQTTLPFSRPVEASGVPTGALLVDVRQAAAALGCGLSLLYELIGAGELPVVKLGRLTRTPVSGLHDLVDRRLGQGGRPVSRDRFCQPETSAVGDSWGGGGQASNLMSRPRAATR